MDRGKWAGTPVASKHLPYQHLSWFSVENPFGTKMKILLLLAFCSSLDAWVQERKWADMPQSGTFSFVCICESFRVSYSDQWYLAGVGQAGPLIRDVMERKEGKNSLSYFHQWYLLKLEKKVQKEILFHTLINEFSWCWCWTRWTSWTVEPRQDGNNAAGR